MLFENGVERIIYRILDISSIHSRSLTRFIDQVWRPWRTIPSSIAPGEIPKIDSKSSEINIKKTSEEMIPDEHPFVLLDAAELDGNDVQTHNCDLTF
jgi:hypothetical protein